ncbi:MAG: hypothetical protein JXB88_25370 [Spirochaetales bacterium]|nr:hypothetical protein [Spirochaetales bacterium]
MEAIKKYIYIDSDIIKIPELKKFIGKHMELILIAEENEENIKKKITVQQFLDKWTGFLGEKTGKDQKLHYLKDKYK